MANGVQEAAQQIDQGAERQTYHVKRLELSPFPLYTPYLAYAAALSDRADMMKALGQSLTQRLSNSQEEKERYIKSGFFPYPEEFKKYLWQPIDWTGEDYEKYAKCISYESDMITLADCIGTCIYWTGHYPYPPYQYGDTARLVSYATGRDIGEDELMKTARRASNVIKAYHLLSGLTKKDDTVPEKFFKETPPAPKVLLNEKRLEKMTLEYYHVRGWDDNGIPKETTLHDLGIDYIHQELKQREILSRSG